MFRFKIIINVITLLALGVLIYAYWDQIYDAITQIKDLNIWLIVLQLPLHIAGLIAIGHLYHSYFKNRTNSKDLTLKDSYKISFEVHFVNSVFPSGGVSGFSYFHLRLRSLGVNFAASTLAQTLRFGLVFVSFLVLLGFGLVGLALSGQANDLVLLMGGSMFFAILATAAIFVYLINSKKRIQEFVAWLPKAVNKVAQIFHYKARKELISLKKVEKSLGEMHYNYRELSSDWSVLKQPFLWALTANILEIASIYLIFLAFGENVNLGAVTLAYGLANFASLIAILPGGLGVYEALMASSLVAGGVMKGFAISGTLVYRVIKLFLFLPISGFFFYLAIHQRSLEKKRQEAASGR